MARLVLLIFMITMAGCADFRIHVKDDAKKIKPSVVLIGPFEIRNLDYDPYISDEFRDALKFELFRKGYKTVQVQKTGSDQIADSQMAVKLCAEHKGDIFIRGVISQRESGFLADRETSTLITFTVYSRDGQVIAEGFYYGDKAAGDESFRRKAADKVIDELFSRFKGND